jgi:hypothetical protein
MRESALAGRAGTHLPREAMHERSRLPSAEPDVILHHMVEYGKRH